MLVILAKLLDMSKLQIPYMREGKLSVKLLLLKDMNV